MDISVVVPVYGCKDALHELYNRLTDTLKSITSDYEIILVNDACPQGSWNVIRELCQNDPKVKGINLSRNFGQHKAILAGLDICRGDAVVVMDCDLQDRPEHIARLYDKLQEGYDIVWARRLNRKDNRAVTFFSKLFYSTINLLTDKHVDSNICNFSIARSNVIKEQCNMRENNRDFSFFQQWLGFNSTFIDLEGDERQSGKSSYSIKRKLKLAFQIITSQSNKPLYISIFIGLLFVLVSVIIIVNSLINYFFYGDVVEGWTSTIISIYLVGGMILLFLGMIGVYIGNMYEELKKRPLYIIKDKLNLKDDSDR